MKKLLYTIGIMMFLSATLQPFVAFGQNGNDQFPTSDEDLPYSSARIFSKLTDKLGINPDLDWGESFGYGEGDEDKVGQDMYLVIYKKVLEDPAEKTMKDISGKYAVSEGDMWLILNGDYTPILDRKPGLSQEELLNKVLEIQGEYEEMRELYNLEANIKAAVEPSEMFANGDLGDSGFDLIHDLDLIEEILFLKTSPIDIGKSYTSATGEGLAQYGQAPATAGQVTAPSGITTPAEPSTVIGGGTETISPSGGPPMETRAGSYEGFNPNACFVEDAYDEALSEFEAKSLEDPNYKDLSAGQTAMSGQYTLPSGPEPEPDISVPDTEPFFPSAPPVTTPVPSAEPDNWLKDRFCPGFFCLELNFVKEPAKSSFENADNCIACHVEKINDVLKTVINHSLVPTKATGNLGESAECHGAMLTAFGSLSMNVYAIFMPIKTPINDDLMYGTNIDEDWENYCNQVAFFPFDLCGEDEEEAGESEEGAGEGSPVETTAEAYEPPPSLVERATKQAAVQAPEDATQEDVSRRTSEQINGYEKEQEEAIQEINVKQVLDENAVFYQPLKYELDRMMYFFKNIQDILHSLHEKVESIPGEQACYKLKNKNECE